MVVISFLQCWSPNSSTLFFQPNFFENAAGATRIWTSASSARSSRWGHIWERDWPNSGYRLASRWACPRSSLPKPPVRFLLGPTTPTSRCGVAPISFSKMSSEFSNPLIIPPLILNLSKNLNSRVSRFKEYCVKKEPMRCRSLGIFIAGVLRHIVVF